MKHFTAGLGLASLFVLFASGGDASATTVARTLAASTCKVTGGDPVYDWNGAIYNDGSSTMVLDCNIPISIDSNDEKVWGVALGYDDKSPQSILCDIRVASWSDGSILTNAAAKTTSNGVGVLSWNTSPGYIGQVFAACFVPPKSGSSRSGILGFQAIYAQ